MEKAKYMLVGGIIGSLLNMIVGITLSWFLGGK